MIRIRYSIVEELNELRSLDEEELLHYGGIGGYIEITCGKKSAGFFHEGPIYVGDCGNENVDYWIEKLLEVTLSFACGAVYAAFALMEENDQSLEFDRQGDRISMQIALAGNRFKNSLFISSEDSKRTGKIQTEDNSADMAEFRTAVLNTAERFIREIELREPLAAKLSTVRRIEQLTKEVREYTHRMSGEKQ